MEIIKIKGEMSWCCPCCDAQLIIDTENSSRTANGAYIFFDSDTIQVDTTRHLVFTDLDFSSSLDVVQCTKCSKHFASINMTFRHFLSEPADRVTKQTNFVIPRKNLRNADHYQNFKCFSLKIYEHSLGTQYDIRLCILPLTLDEANDLVDIHNVLSCVSSNILQQATNIVEEFLRLNQDLILCICHGIPANNRS